MQKSTPQVPEATEEAPEPMKEVAVGTREEEVVVPPKATLEVVVRSPEIRTQSPSALR
jgi:hypothetical protein